MADAETYLISQVEVRRAHRRQRPFNISWLSTDGPWPLPAPSSRLGPGPGTHECLVTYLGDVTKALPSGLS